MKTITDIMAGPQLPHLIVEAAESHEPIQITGDRANGVLVSEDDWRSIEETLYLLSIPGLRDSIRDGMQTPISECSESIPW